jgi:hypothetical protein
MTDKKALLFVVAVSFLNATENPFSVAKNMQKIEEEENRFLKVLEKSKATLGNKKEIVSVQTTPDKELNATDSKKAEPQISDTEKNHEVQTAVSAAHEKDIEKSDVIVAAKEEKLPAVKKEKKADRPKPSLGKKPTPKKEIASTEKEKSAVDAKIKTLEKNLETISNTKSTVPSKHSYEFEERLKEAIESVQD